MDQYIGYNKQNDNNIVLQTIDPLTSEVMIIPRFTKIRCVILILKKRLVALKGFDSMSSIIHFKLVEDLFAFVKDADVPVNKSIYRLETARQISIMKENYYSTIKSYRNIIFVNIMVI